MREINSSIERGAAALDKFEESQVGATQAAPAAIINGSGTSAGDAAVPPNPTAEQQSGKRSQATLLLELCSALEMFHDDEQNGYAVLDHAGHREVWPMESRSFKHWLEHRFYKQFGRAIGKDALDDALGALQARARFDCPGRPVFRRIAWQGNRIYLDLCDAGWRVVEIDASGWRVLEHSPVMFTRSDAMQALPEPMPGNLLDLSKILNLHPQELPLVMGYIFMAARGKGPYPVLLVQGEQGSGKSTFTRFVRNLIDPSSVPLRGLTNDPRDLMVTATNNHVIVLDNLSGLSPQISDILCRFATGGGFAERKLYTNREEVVVDIKRPVILNGIDEIATRGDLLDRALIVHLPVIADTERVEEEIAEQRYEALRPALLGGLCTALSHALERLPHVRLSRKPRMADFAVWVTAAEGALGWPEGTIMAAYWRHRDGALEAALEASPVIETLVQFMSDQDRWQGTSTELLGALERYAYKNGGRISGSWPRTGQGLTNAMKRSAEVLRHHGIRVEDGMRSGHEGKRTKILTKVAKPSSALSALSATTLEGGGAQAGMLTIPSLATAPNANTSSVVSPCVDGLADNADDTDKGFSKLLDDGEVEEEL